MMSLVYFLSEYCIKRKWFLSIGITQDGKLLMIQVIKNLGTNNSGHKSVTNTMTFDIPLFEATESKEAEEVIRKLLDQVEASFEKFIKENATGKGSGIIRDINGKPFTNN